MVPSVHSAANIRLMLGQAALRRGDTATARRAFDEALDTLRALGAVADEAEALGRLGDLEAGTGRPLAAESLYQRGLARLGARPAPGVAWPLHAGIAGVLRSRGALADAAGELRAAIAQIERVSGTLPLEEQRSAFRADKWDPYVNLALVERARGRTEAAFEASERLRARQMLDLLARGRVAQGPALGSLASREQDLRRRMAELTRQAKGAGGGAPGLRGAAPNEASASAANEALTHTQDEYAQLLTEMREANPAYTALVKGEIAPAHAVRSALAPDEALLEYLVGDSTTLVFVVTSDSVAALDLHVSHNALMALVDFARSTLASPTEQAGRPAWRPPLRRLYGYLISPVEASGLLAGKRRLLIAPHAELHYLPFATLVRRGTPEQFLVERYVLEYVPSASVWLRLRDRLVPARNGGVLAFAPRPAALPGSRAEVTAIQRTYGSRARTLVGRTATESTFRMLAPEQEIVHLATHGVLNKHNPLFSFVQLGAGGGDDGRLEVHEVFGLTLNARLLVLSACQTGVAAGAVADVPPGDDWIGLVQGFLYAGAGNVLATLWPVADVATARVMERFYGELAGGRSEAEALALAQRTAARDPGTAHPFFWAGFTLVRGR
jgi:CHAT domain-containing protein